MMVCYCTHKRSLCTTQRLRADQSLHRDHPLVSCNKETSSCMLSNNSAWIEKWRNASFVRCRCQNHHHHHHPGHPRELVRPGLIHIGKYQLRSPDSLSGLLSTTDAGLMCPRLLAPEPRCNAIYPKKHGLESRVVHVFLVRKTCAYRTVGPKKHARST